MSILTPAKRKLTFFSALFTFFVDYLGWAIVFPIFAPYFLDEKNILFSSAVSIPIRTIILGLFLAAFPVAQFFGAPILGEYADKFGRKKAFIISVILTFLGYVLSAFSIRYNMLFLLFIGRFVTGVFSGNLSICLATISDLSPSKAAKVRNFGYLSVLAGFSFIAGAFLGGKFSDVTVSTFFTPALPFWIAAGLSVLNLFIIIFVFFETLDVHKNLKFDFLESVHNIQQALKTEKIMPVYLIYFLFVFGWTILFQFVPVLMVQEFAFSNSQIGNLAAFMGICWALGSGVINKILLRKFSALRILEVALLSFTILCGAIAIKMQVDWIMIIIGMCVLLGGIAWPLCTSLISDLAPNRMQGKILGMSQSMQSLAMATSPIVAGLVSQISLHMSFIIAAISGLVAALVYFKTKL